jgi:uncharacterized protein (DUF3084 family)
VHYAPVQQEMSTGTWPSPSDLQERQKLITQKEDQLHELEKQLQQHQQPVLTLPTHIKGLQQQVSVNERI